MGKNRRDNFCTTLLVLTFVQTDAIDTIGILVPWYKIRAHNMDMAHSPRCSGLNSKNLDLLLASHACIGTHHPSSTSHAPGKICK
jgi:hypothetical protein